MVITLAQIEGHDPHAPPGYPRRRFLCLFPECDGKSNRNLDVDVLQGVYVCHRCGAKGKLGQEGQTGYVPPPRPKNLRPKKPWPELLACSNIMNLAGTAGQTYLEGRGISLELALKCGVRFAGSLCRRAAVLFDIRDEHGNLVAVQGRHIDRADPRMHTLGPNKLGAFQTPGALQTDFAIAEAPLDAISLYALGMPAIAVCGTGMPKWIPELSAGKEIWIASDGDAQGDKDFDVWAPVLERAGAEVSRMRPPHAGQPKPWAPESLMNDWNDELQWRQFYERREQRACPPVRGGGGKR